LIAIIVAIPPEPALGYILPADAILSAAAKRRAGIAFKTLIAEGKYTKGETTVTAWEAIHASKAYRVEHKGPSSTNVRLTVGKNLWTFSLGEAAKPQSGKNNLILTFLGTPEKDPGGRRGMSFLEQHGIDRTVMSLSRLDRRIVYVIGAAPGETDKPQLWMDKEYLLPVRLITVDKKAGVTRDVRLFGYGSAATGEWFPRRVEVWENGTLVEKTTYTRARLNDDVDPELFKPPTTKGQ